MRIREPSRPSSSAQLEQVFYDWTKKAMQLAAIACVALLGYLAYGFLAGGVGNWSSLDSAAQARIGANIQGTILYLNVSLAALLLSSIILYYDEESFGYVLVFGALALYLGVPFLVDSQMQGEVARWESANNVPMLALYHEARVAALILVVPGVGLTLYDIIRRVLDAGTEGRRDLTALTFGGDAQREIAPAGPALIGSFAKCWQLPFCRESLRVRCPIYYRKTRCWRERVGCMCEEHSIRQSLAAFFDQKPTTEGTLDFATGLHTGEAAQAGSSVPTGPKSDTIRIPEIRRDQARIPYNTTIPAQAKRERCRECIIYNEHQRHKYQLLAPIVVTAIPAMAFLRIEELLHYLRAMLKTADSVMAHLSFDPNVQSSGLASATTSSDVANFVMIGCLVIMVTTMALRFLEHIVFTLKA